MKTDHPGTDSPKIEKAPLAAMLHRPETSALRRYRAKAVGDVSAAQFAGHELRILLFTHLPGGIGYFLRKRFFAPMFRRSGSGLILGKGLALRHPGRISLGDRVAIDDHCLLDAAGHVAGLQIGDDVIVSRNCVVQAKSGPVRIGNRTDIGCNAVLSAISGIEIGEAVLIAANAYIGGARYRTDRSDIPYMDQGIFSRGSVVVGDGAWLGAGVIVIDGVRIGEGCVVGAGAVVTADLPPRSIAVGVPARIVKTGEALSDG
jgi:acetyltransferase-like isoleucine patch superfamily enzyme